MGGYGVAAVTAAFTGAGVVAGAAAGTVAVVGVDGVASMSSGVESTEGNKEEGQGPGKDGGDLVENKEEDEYSEGKV